MRLPAFALATVVALASLTACSDDSDDGDAKDQSSQTPQEVDDEVEGAELSPAELELALLTTANLSDEFEIDPPEDDEEEDDGEPDLGCLFAFDDEDDEDDDDGEGEIAFSAKEEPGLPGVFQFLAVAETDDKAQVGLDEISDLLDDCERVDTQDDDGTRWQLDVTHDRDTWATESDAQVNLSAVGTLGMGSLEVPLTIDLSVVRVDNGVSITAFFDMAHDIGSAHEDVTDAATARLAAVLAGEEPPEAEPVLEGYPIGEAFSELTDAPDIEA